MAVGCGPANSRYRHQVYLIFPSRWLPPLPFCVILLLGRPDLGWIPLPGNDWCTASPRVRSISFIASRRLLLPSSCAILLSDRLGSAVVRPSVVDRRVAAMGAKSLYCFLPVAVAGILCYTIVREIKRRVFGRATWGVIWRIKDRLISFLYICTCYKRSFLPRNQYGFYYIVGAVNFFDINHCRGISVSSRHVWVWPLIGIGVSAARCSSSSSASLRPSTRQEPPCGRLLACSPHCGSGIAWESACAGLIFASVWDIL